MKHPIAQAFIFAMLSTPLVYGSGIYNFDEGAGAVAFDSSGQGNDGAISGASFTSGPGGGADFALHFAILNDNVRLPQSIVNDFSNTAYVEAMIKPTSYPGGPLGCEATIMRKRAAFNDWGLSLVGNGEIYTYLYDGSGSSAVGASGGFVPLNVWTKVASFYDGSAMHVFVNDIEVATQAAVVTPDWSSLGIEIGNDTFDTGINCGDYGFKGDIDDVKILPTPPHINCIIGDSFNTGPSVDADVGAWIVHASPSVPPNIGATAVSGFLDGSDASNPKVLQLRFPASAPSTNSGGGQWATSISTRQARSFGEYEARLKPTGVVMDGAPSPHPAGVVSGFFTYFHSSDPGQIDINDEIDIEFLSWEPSVVYLTVWTRFDQNGQGGASRRNRLSRRVDVGTGKLVETPTPTSDDYYFKGVLPNKFKVPGFRASKQYHRYGFDWEPSSVMFWIDLEDGAGRHELWRLPKVSTSEIPQHASQVILNTWYTPDLFCGVGQCSIAPNPLPLLPPAQDADFLIDWIKFPACGGE